MLENKNSNPRNESSANILEIFGPQRIITCIHQSNFGGPNCVSLRSLRFAFRDAAPHVRRYAKQITVSGVETPYHLRSFITVHKYYSWVSYLHNKPWKLLSDESGRKLKIYRKNIYIIFSILTKEHTIDTGTVQAYSAWAGSTDAGLRSHVKAHGQLQLRKYRSVRIRPNVS